MNFGKDFFKILNFVIAIIRLIAKIFGDDETKKEVEDSKARSANSNPNDTV